MSLNLPLILGICLLSLACSERARYDNYRVYKVIASSDAELEVLQDLDGGSDSLIFMDGIHGANKGINVVVAPHKLPDFLSIMGTNDIEYKLIETNLQSILEDTDDNEVATDADGYTWTEYHKLDDTYTWMTRLASEYPGIVTVIEGGKTYEHRSILGVKISFAKGQASRPGIFLEAGIHAREWIAPATATYIINQLLTSQDANIKELANNYDWYIFPHANPDGYVYTHTSDRMWRKTRTPYKGGCFGADPNRNWDFFWNTVGSSDKPCSDTFAGPSAFSEIETKSLANYIASLSGKIHLYISFHAYSQYLLYPYGHTSALPENHKDYERVFNVTINALNKRYGTKYTGGNIYDAIYPASGASVDWAFGQGVQMSFCYELRPSSNSLLTGFKLPPAQIIPTGEETLDSMIAMIREVQNLGYFN